MHLAQIRLAALGLALLAVGGMSGRAAEAKHYSFGYDQPHTTGYGIGADLFAAKLAELSKGTMMIDQFPGAQLGQEPQMLQKIRTGDIDFMFSSTRPTPRPSRRSPACCRSISCSAQRRTW